MEELIQILEDIRPDADFTKEKKLIDNSILDSFDIVSLVGELNDEFDIDINPAELVPENFNSVEAMYKMIERLQDE